MSITAELINVGRKQINKTITVKDVTALHKEIDKHLLSSGWGMAESETNADIYILTSGIREVGQVKIISTDEATPTTDT